MPAVEKIRAAQKLLSYRDHPNNDPAKVQRLLDSLQSITCRLQSLDIAHDRLAARSSDPIVSADASACGLLQRVFEQWARFEAGDAFKEHSASLQQMSRDLEQRLDSLEPAIDREPRNDRILADFYTMLGSLRGLIEAMADAQDVINQINWRQWATARF